MTAPTFGPDVEVHDIEIKLAIDDPRPDPLSTFKFKIVDPDD